MSERGTGLMQAMHDAQVEWFEDDTTEDDATSMGAVARAICEHLGLTREDFHTCQCGCEQTVIAAKAKRKVTHALATLLEAASIEPPEQP